MPGEEDEPLQAVILADTYNERLKPLTANQPRVCTCTPQAITTDVDFRLGYGGLVPVTYL